MIKKIDKSLKEKKRNLKIKILGPRTCDLTPALT